MWFHVPQALGAKTCLKFKVGFLPTGRHQGAGGCGWQMVRGDSADGDDGDNGDDGDDFSITDER